MCKQYSVLFLWSTIVGCTCAVKNFLVPRPTLGPSTHPPRSAPWRWRHLSRKVKFPENLLFKKTVSARLRIKIWRSESRRILRTSWNACTRGFQAGIVGNFFPCFRLYFLKNYSTSKGHIFLFFNLHCFCGFPRMQEWRAPIFIFSRNVFFGSKNIFWWWF